MLPDVQKDGTPDVKGIDLQKVGIRELKIPVNFVTKNNSIMTLETNVSMYVDLNAEVKGISMSRLPRTLYEYLEKEEVSFRLMEDILKDFKEKLKSKNSFMKFKFNYPLIKKAPASGLEGWEYYPTYVEKKLIGDEITTYIRVIVRYMSHCPCSAELSEHLRKQNINAYPHAQPGYATVTVKVKNGTMLYIEDLIKTIEEAIYTIPYPIVKREDEMEIARRSGEVQIFVEDASRRISYGVNKLGEVEDWLVVCNHDEELHTHYATSIVFKGIEGGLR